MSFNLWNAKFFADLQSSLEQVTKEMVDKLAPLGNSVPPRAVVVGVVPDHLKAILAVADLVGDTNYDYMNTFDIALRAEFPALSGKNVVGFGPNWEIYYEKDDLGIDIDISELGADSGSIIGFSGLSVVGDQSPMRY